jgi:hypothetical protein
MTRHHRDHTEGLASAMAMLGACHLLALGACSSSTNSGLGGNGTCAAPSGLYDYVFTNAQTNDPPYCPLPSNFEEVLPSNTTTAFGCALSASNGPNVSCSQSIELQCPVRTFDGYGGVVTSIGTADSNADASLVKGHVDMKLVYANGQGTCAAHWDFTVTRLHQ